MRVAILAYGYALDIFHHQVRPAIRGRAAINQARDVRKLEVGQNLSFGAEALDDEIRIHAPLDELDGDVFLVLIIIAYRQINCAHSAASNLSKDLIRSNAYTGERVAISIAEDLKSFLQSRRVNRAARLFVIGKQRLDLGPQCFVAGAGLLEQCRALAATTFER